MIRLVCLRQVLERITREEANALSMGNSTYITLFNVLPYVVPSANWYEPIQVRLLSGIKPSVVNNTLEEKMSNTKLLRIRKSDRMPYGKIICNKGILSDEDYIKAAQGFWSTVLKPLQLPDFPIEEPTFYLKIYHIQQVMRSSSYTLKFILKLLNPTLHDAAVVVASVQSLNLNDIALFWNQEDYPGISKRSYLISANAEHYYNTPANKLLDGDPVVYEKYKKLYNDYQAEIDIIYSLLYRLCAFGYINDALMEGEYEIEFYK